MPRERSTAPASRTRASIGPCTRVSSPVGIYTKTRTHGSYDGTVSRDGENRGIAPLARAMAAPPLDVLVAAAAAGARVDARDVVDPFATAVDASGATERARAAVDEDAPPEFAFGSSSSEWSSSASESDDASDGSDSETSCESIDAADLPAWLKRARDGPVRTEDEADDATHAAPPRTRNEIDADARAVAPVPTIEASEEIRSIGRVMSVVGRTVVVGSAARGRTAEGEETLDEESVLCLGDRTGLGVIEEVFGPVSSPLYSLRLPAEEDGASGGAKVRVDDEVFVVVGRSKTIPNVKSLYKKGYDASGKDDEEVVEEEEFSDDEKEAAAKAAKKNPAKKRSARGGGGRGGGGRAPPPPPIMGGGGYFGMQGLPRPPAPHSAPTYGGAAGAPVMYVPVSYNAQGQPVIVVPPQGYGAPPRGPPPPPPPPPPSS